MNLHKEYFGYIHHRGFYADIKFEKGQKNIIIYNKYGYPTGYIPIYTMELLLPSFIRVIDHVLEQYPQSGL